MAVFDKSLLEYFQSYDTYFWEWEDEGKVLAFRCGATICYTESLIELLEEFSDEGLPRLGVLLVWIAAVTHKPHVDTVIDFYEARSEELGDIDLVGQFLGILADLPSQYRKGNARKVLFQTLVQHSHNSISKHKSKKILKLYHDVGLQENDLRHAVLSKTVLWREFRVLELLARKFRSQESLLLAMSNYLPEVTETVELPPASLDDKPWLEQLLGHAETFYESRLISYIWACMQLPFHKGSRGDQSLGGVSDMSNKGHFDQLLLSEFAYDDTSFMMRLANREALYYKREVPPKTPDKKHVVLIDHSIKNWGFTKSISFGVALALAAHPQKDWQCKFYLVGHECVPIALDTIEDVIAALGKLSPALHPGEGLKNYFAFYHETDAEVLLLGARTSQIYEEVQQVVSENEPAIRYWFETSETGKVDVYRWQRKSKKHWQSFSLPLDELWKKEEKSKFRQQSEKLTSSHEQFPLLVGGSAHYKTFIGYSDVHFYMITKELDILRYYDPYNTHIRGWEKVGKWDKMPTACAMGVDELDRYHLLTYLYQTGEVCIRCDETGETLKSKFAHFNPKQPRFVFYEACFYYFLPHAYWKWDLKGGMTEHTNKTLWGEILNESKQLDDRLRSHVAKVSTLKYLGSCYINNDRELVLGNFHLQESSGVVRLMSCKNTSVLKESTYSAGTSWTFADGSTVRVDSSGVIILRSSAIEIPTIYIYGKLRKALAMSTENKFCGNGYYFADGKARLMIKTPTENRNKVFQLVHKATHKPLPEVKKYFDQHEQLYLVMGSAKAQVLGGQLFHLGTDVDIAYLKNREMRQVSVKEFFALYINKFVDKIIRHENPA